MPTERNIKTVENEIEPQFNIPESAYSPILDLVRMEQRDFDAFIAGLKSAKPSISSTSLSRHIASGLPKSSSASVASIVEEIMTLEYLKQDTEMSAEEFAVAISESALCASSEKFPFEPYDSEVLKLRLTAIFKSDHVLELNTKANAVLTDHDNLFLSTKIVTDARPVFDDEGSKLEAFTIVHMLRIHFAHNSEHEDFFVALDVGDIRKLRHVLDRAEKKADILKRTFKASNIPYLDIEPTNDNV